MLDARALTARLTLPQLKASTDMCPVNWVMFLVAEQNS